MGSKSFLQHFLFVIIVVPALAWFFIMMCGDEPAEPSPFFRRKGLYNMMRPILDFLFEYSGIVGIFLLLIGFWQLMGWPSLVRENEYGYDYSLVYIAASTAMFGIGFIAHGIFC